jgi:PAS domain S-box-containing protein
VQQERVKLWHGRVYLGIAVALVCAHVAMTLAAPSWGGLGSDVLETVAGFLAAGAALWAGKRAQGFARLFWTFQACGFLLFGVAQALAAFYDSVLHMPLDQPWPSDMLFFLWVTPAFLSLFLDRKTHSARIEWVRWLDFAQVGILVVSAHLYVFEVPAHWFSKQFPYEKVELAATIARDVLIVLCFAWRALREKGKQARSLYGRMALFFLVFTLAECSYVYLQVFYRLRAPSFWDVPWTVAMSLAMVLAVTADPKADGEAAIEETPRKRRAITRIALRLVPLCFPMVVLLMAAHIAEQQFAIAVLAVMASFACSSARIILTERNQVLADKALRERNALLKSVFEGSGDAIFVKDAEGRYLIVNSAIGTYYGKPIEEIVGKTAFELTDADSARELTRHDKRILENGENVTVDFQISRDGATRHFLVTRVPYRDSSGKVIGVTGISRDITQYKAIEDRLRQSQKMEAIGTLAGGVAHDFNNILMVISGYSSVLAEALKGNPKLLGHVEQVQKAGERAGSLTRQLLAFSRKETVQPAPINVNDVVTGIEKLLHRLIGEHITISTELAMDLGMVMADAGQIEQVILNLAVNARDAMPEGGKVSIETRNTLLGYEKGKGPADAKPGEYVELAVTDSGVGMEPGVKAHVFEPFFTTKPAGKGTGLGLSTVYGIVQQAGGYVTFESELGLGTSFHIFLPRIYSTPKVVSTAELGGERTHGGETVLLVEDDASVCELVRAVLTKHGYSVLAAQRPQEAETICREYGQKIDLLLTDVILPEMTGPDLAKRLMARDPAMRIMFMSGYIDDSVVREEIREKGIAYLQKPFTPANLVKKVRDVLDAVEVR